MYVRDKSRTYTGPAHWMPAASTRLVLCRQLRAAPRDP